MAGSKPRGDIPQSWTDSMDRLKKAATNGVSTITKLKATIKTSMTQTEVDSARQQLDTISEALEGVADVEPPPPPPE